MSNKSDTSELVSPWDKNDILTKRRATDKNAHSV